MAVTGVNLINLYMTLLLFTSFAVVTNGQNNITKGENSSTTLNQDEDKRASPKQHVDAVEGGTALLKCSVGRSVENLTVEWYKEGAERKRIVHVYRHKNDCRDMQESEFRGKTTLDHEGLKKGIVSLELRSVQLNFSGQYICFNPPLEILCNITLNIVSNGQNMTKGENSSTTGPAGEDNQGHQNRDVAIGVGVAIVLLIFVIGILIKPKLRRQEATSIINREPVRAPEYQPPKDVVITFEPQSRETNQSTVESE